MSARVISAAPVEVTEVVDGTRTAHFEETALTLPDAGSLALMRKRLARPGVDARTPLLLVHGFGQNLHAWHLSRRSLANHLAAAGHDVFSVDLRGHGRSRATHDRAPANLRPYLDHDLPAALDAIAAISGHERVTLVGHSLGGMLAYAIAARHPGRVAAVVGLATPYFWGRDASFVHALSRAAALVGRGSTAFPMGAVGGLLRATQPLWDTPWLPMPIRAWHPGGFEPEVLAEYLARSFDRASFGELAQLVASRADADDHFAREFEGCDVPLLVVAGAHDHLARPAAVRPAYDRSRARDRTYVTFPSGHGDLLLGRKAPHLLWPTLTRWLHRRTSP